MKFGSLSPKKLNSMTLASLSDLEARTSARFGQKDFSKGAVAFVLFGVHGAVGSASGCDPEGRRFEPGWTPQFSNQRV